MSGLEIVGVVGTLVGAFAAAATLFQVWQNKRHERKKQGENQAVDGVLTRSGREIQHEYNEHFRRLGSLFARGDGKRLCKSKTVVMI